MHPPRNGRAETRVAVLGAVVPNALALLGVLVWDWNLAAVVAIYWLEVGIGLWWAALEAGVAERPSDYSEDMLLLGSVRYRRGGISIPGTSLTWYVHNLPIAGQTLFVFGGAWAIIAVFLLIPVLDAQGSSASLAGIAYSVLGAGAFLFVGRGWETVSTYVGERRYREVAATHVVQDALWPLWILGILIMFFVPVVGEAGDAGGIFFLAVLISGKFLFDLLWVTYGSIHALHEAKPHLFLVDDPFADDIDWEPRPLENAPDRTGNPIRPRRLGVVLGGITNGLDSVLGILVGLFSAWVLFLVLLGGEVVILWWITIPLAVVVGFGILDNVLRHWGTTYRLTADGRLARCGRLLAGPHWVVAPDRLSSVESVSTWTDRLLGTTTVELVLEAESGEQERTIRLPYLPDQDANVVLEALLSSNPSDTVDRGHRASVDTPA